MASRKRQRDSSKKMTDAYPSTMFWRVDSSCRFLARRCCSLILCFSISALVWPDP